MHTRYLHSAYLIVTLVLCALPSPLCAEAALANAAPAAAGAPVTLYDGVGSPAAEGFTYLIQPFSASATQVGNNLNTTPKITDLAGFFARSALVPSLDRQAGYSVRFNAQLNAENHAGSDRNGDGKDDRAGFSVLVLSSDVRGIELAFWRDRVWAQEGGAAEPPTGTLFTHAEEALWDGTKPTAYDLDVEGNTYTLHSGATLILQGSLRDYRAFSGPLSPYNTPNLLFLGDNTSSAAASVTLSGPINVLAQPTARYLLPLVAKDLTHKTRVRASAQHRAYEPVSVGSLPTFLAHVRFATKIRCRARSTLVGATPVQGVSQQHLIGRMQPDIEVVAGR